MSKIFCLMGKSSSGKDTIYRMLFENPALNLKSIVPYTTRPIRYGEQEGKEYHFVDETALLQLEDEGKVVEKRVYHTVHGDWTYFTVDDGHIDLEKNDYLLIGTVESFSNIKKYFGKEVVIPIYIEVDDGIRLQRALSREMSQKEPKYAEMCRRFLADAEDFSEERLIDAGIEKRFSNDFLEDTITNIETYIKAMES